MTEPKPKTEPVTRRILGVRLAALIETVVLLGAMIAWDSIWGSGDRFFHVQPHPFWVPVLLVSAQYGLGEGLFAAAAASAALLAFNIPDDFAADIFAQSALLAVNPVMWVCGALLVGGLSERHLRRIRDQKETIAALDAEAENLRSGVERLARANEALENRVAGQLMTFASLYEAAKAVEKETPGEVLMGAARLVRSALNAKEFSIYLLNEGALEAALCEGWPDSSSRARRFRAGTPLFDHVVAQRDTVHVATPMGETILAHQGLVAGPILNPATGVVRGMVKIERMGFEDFTPSAVHNFRVLCDWLGAALARAEDLQLARATQTQSNLPTAAESGPLLSRRLLSRIEDMLARLAKRERFALTALDVDIETQSIDKAVLARIVAGAAAEALRGTDFAFEGADGRGCCVLLPSADEVPARAAANRLQLALEARFAAAHIETDIRVTLRLLSSPALSEPEPKRARA